MENKKEAGSMIPKTLRKPILITFMAIGVSLLGCNLVLLYTILTGVI